MRSLPFDIGGGGARVRAAARVCAARDHVTVRN